MRQDGQDASDRRLTAGNVPMMTASPSSSSGPIGVAGEPDRGGIVLPTTEQTLWETPRLPG
jgi:hypothetical protein